jgi:hypothetical protein
MPGGQACGKRVFLTLEQLACKLLVRLGHDAIILAGVGVVIMHPPWMSSVRIRSWGWEEY